MNDKTKHWIDRVVILAVLAIGMIMIAATDRQARNEIRNEFSELNDAVADWGSYYENYQLHLYEWHMESEGWTEQQKQDHDMKWYGFVQDEYEYGAQP